MNIDDYSKIKKSRVTKTYLRKLVLEGLINEDLTDGDLEFLQRMEKLWGKHDFLRAQLKTMPKKRRESLLFTSRYKYTWEQRLHTMLFNLKHDGKRINLKERILRLAEEMPSLQKDINTNEHYVNKMAKRILRQVDKDLEDYRKAVKETGRGRCPECGRIYRQTKYTPQKSPL